MNNNSTPDNDKIKILLAAFKASLEQTFETMVFMQALCTEPQVKHDHFPSGAVSGTIGVTGEHFQGRLSLIFTQAIAERAFRSMMMMGAEDPVNESELKDAIGELANMTAGGAKAQLQQQGYDFVISLPTVVMGLNHHLESPKGCETLVLPVNIGNDVFHMEVAIV